MKFLLTMSNVKIVIGLVLGFGIGLVCAVAGIPSPAPPVLIGASVVLAMTIGWTLTDRMFARRPNRHIEHCGGPTGLPGSDPKDK